MPDSNSAKLVETIYCKCKFIADEAEEVLTHCRALPTADHGIWASIMDVEAVARDAMRKLELARNEMEFKSRMEAAE